DCGSCPEDCACGGFCEGKASGLWCDGNDLVNCQGGAVASETPCPCSCTSMPPGVNDECAACGGDFCEGKASGLWCDGNDLVKCQGGAVASETPCPCGCTSMPPGVNDECAACGGDFCEGKASGLWCDGDDLVKCQGGAVASVTDCPCGCKSNPPGVNDECESCGSGDFCEGKASGLWCDGDDLVNCQGGAVASVTPCPCGCKGNDPGVNDECESCGSGTFCEEHGDGTWCDGETLVQCTGGQQAWYQPCPFGCGPGQDGAAGCLEAPAPDFCDGRPNGSWCDGNVLTHCKAEDVVGSEDCPLGCEPPAAVGPGQCLGPHAEPSEDTLAAPDAGPGADVPTTPEDVPPGGFGDGSLVLEGEPLPGGGGGPSSGCAAAPRAPVLPWLLLALALVLSRPSRSSRGSARLLLVLVLLLPGFPRELGASPSAAKSVLLVNMNPGEPASEAYQRIEETLRRLAPDLVVRAAHFRALSSEGLRRSPPDALILGPQGTPWWEYPRDELDRFAALVREFPGPILGICGGHQFLAMAFGGTVAPISCPAEAVGYKGCEREQGVVAVELSGVDSPLLRGLSSPIRVSESHYEEVKRLPTGFVTLASSPTSAVQVMAHETRLIYGVQFHPERADAAHPDGWTILERFLDQAGLRPPCESTGRPAP
ncbi:MAG: gamma-glutamyl-gamma-aminobutyrate hydrolase family protein, partial [Deltaproteobacteria bacterium]|nr:gamma-glutamyl-gamma-aminobutyrate hydrolase family protein [Deltaproteobacteria bacterium]